MDPKKSNIDPFTFPHDKEHLTLRLRPTANAWWKDPFKVYLLLEAFDNHCASVGEACYVAGITRRQYKYFAQEHPVIYERRKAAKFAKREREIVRKRMELAQRVLDGDARASAQYLAYENPEGYDNRYRSTYARLRRIHGLPAWKPQKSPEEQYRDAERAVENLRKMVEHPSNPKHYAVCEQCAHLRKPVSA